MRIEEGKRKGFKEFSIVIESEEEAKFVYHNFNNCITKSFAEYIKNHELDNNIYAGIQFDMWNIICNEIRKQEISTD